jgi:hypothetical protein
LLMEEIDRKCELQRMYDEATDPALKLKIATEIRLSSGQASRLLKDLQPKLPRAALSNRASTRASNRARRAANMRWGNVSA